MVLAAALLDTLHAPSTNGVGKVYRQLKSILGTAAALQTESSLKHQVEATVSTPIHPKDSTGDKGPPRGLRRREHLSSPARISAYGQLS
jgi:hypothetical protein